MINSIAQFCYAVLLSTCVLCSLSCQKEQSNTYHFNGERAFAEVEQIVAYAPRDAGTPGGKKAADHIANRLETIGLRVKMDAFTDTTPEGLKNMVNVFGFRPGSSRHWIILGSHFDTMPGIDNFQGANDSGSSTGVLIELARSLKDKELHHGLIFAFFDGEEGIANYIPGDGLHGSRRFANQLKDEGELDRYLAMILLDMVGDKNLNFTVPANSDPMLLNLLLNAAERLDIREKIQLHRHTTIIDDHVPFLDIGIPAIDLIDFKFGSHDHANDYWHTSEDSLDKISSESLKITGKITLEMLDELGLFLKKHPQ